MNSVYIDKDDIGRIESCEDRDFLLERKNDKEFVVHHEDLIIAVKVDRFGGITAELVDGNVAPLREEE